MATRSEMDEHRKERYRREQARKKRVRRNLRILGVVVVLGAICIAAAAINNKKLSNKDNIALNQQEQTATVDENQAPAEVGGDSFVITGYLDGKETGSSVVNYTKIAMEAEKNAVPENSAIPPADEENDLIEVITNSGEKKHCYLTFDDGPTTNITPQILDTLRKYNVKATFFQVGSLIKANPDLARRVYEEGHLIANHSQNHEYDKLYASTESFMNEVDECYEEIKRVTGDDNYFKLVRFPGGGFNSSADSYSGVKQQAKAILGENGYYFCDWNTLNGDAEGRTKNAAELLEFLKEYSVGYNNLIVLMHDASTKQATADYLGSAIEWLMNEGYTFHRLDEIEFVDEATEVAEIDNQTETTSTNVQ